MQAPWIERLALLLLCAAYLQGSLTKLLDWPSAVAEMERFGVKPAPLAAAAAIAFELSCSVLVLSGAWRWIGALLLAGFTLAATFLALRFWELRPSARMSAENAFFEHLGLVGGFLLVAVNDLRGRGSRTAHF